MSEKREFQAGLFLAVGIALFIASIWVVGQNRQVFARGSRYFASFKNVRGLSTGAPVRLGGITVGRVESIEFEEDVKSPKIKVALLVNNKYTDRIRNDSVVSLQTQGLLGDQYIGISTGVGDNKVKPLSTLAVDEGSDLSGVLEKAGQVVDNTVEISENVNTVLKEIRSDTLSKLSDGIERVSDILKEVQEGDGFLNALVYGDQGSESVDALTDAAKGLAVTANDISQIAQEIKSGEGLLHNLVYGKTPDSLSGIVNKLSRSAENLEEATGALASGEGTLGALLVDAQLYDNLVEVTDGAKRSFILRHLIRKAMEDGGK